MPATGAHFVGLNARKLGWDFEGQPAELVRAEHYDGYRRQLYARVGLPFAPGSGPVAELPR